MKKVLLTGVVSAILLTGCTINNPQKVAKYNTVDIKKEMSIEISSNLNLEIVNGVLRGTTTKNTQTPVTIDNKILLKNDKCELTNNNVPKCYSEFSEINNDNLEVLTDVYQLKEEIRDNTNLMLSWSLTDENGQITDDYKIITADENGVFKENLKKILFNNDIIETKAEFAISIVENNETKGKTYRIPVSERQIKDLEELYNIELEREKLLKEKEELVF